MLTLIYLKYLNSSVLFIYLKIKRSRSLSYSATGIIMATMAGTVVTSELSGVGDGDAAEVGAHAEDDQPLGVLDTLGVRLGVPQGGGVT